MPEVIYEVYGPENCAACNVCTFSEGNDGHIVYQLEGAGFNGTHAHQCLNWPPSAGACSVHEGCAGAGGGGGSLALARPTDAELDAVFQDPVNLGSVMLARYPESVKLNVQRSSLQFVGCSEGALVGNVSLSSDQIEQLLLAMEG